MCLAARSSSAQLRPPVDHYQPRMECNWGRSSDRSFFCSMLIVADLTKRHQLVPHAFADDTQIYDFCSRPCDVVLLSDRMSVCTDEVMSWMTANRLQANPSKTEVTCCSSGRRQHKIPTTSAPWTCCRFLRSAISVCISTRTSPRGRTNRCTVRSWPCPVSERFRKAIASSD